MFLSHTENAHKDRHEKHLPHASIFTSFNETQIRHPSRSDFCDKRKDSARQNELLYYAVS